jgi:hypothetical protein
MVYHGTAGCTSMLALFVSIRTCLRNSISAQSIAATSTAAASLRNKFSLVGGLGINSCGVLLVKRSSKQPKPKVHRKEPTGFLWKELHPV